MLLKINKASDWPDGGSDVRAPLLNRSCASCSWGWTVVQCGGWGGEDGLLCGTKKRGDGGSWGDGTAARSETSADVRGADGGQKSMQTHACTCSSHVWTKTLRVPFQHGRLFCYTQQNKLFWRAERHWHFAGGDGSVMMMQVLVCVCVCVCVCVEVGWGVREGGSATSYGHLQSPAHSQPPKHELISA